MTLATSSGRPRRPIGSDAANPSSASRGSANMGVSIDPGAMPLTRTVLRRELA
jgi:hypothetical protein